MPEFQYFWSMVGLFVATGTMFAFAIGILGVKMTVSRRTY